MCKRQIFVFIQLVLDQDQFMSLVFCDSLTLLPAGFRGAGGGYEALPRGPEVGGPVLPERQPGQDGDLPGALGANRRPGGSQKQTKTGRVITIF